jgi:hypothetical protein
MLPEHGPNFVEVARTQQKVEQACSRGWKHAWGSSCGQLQGAIAKFRAQYEGCPESKDTSRLGR